MRRNIIIIVKIVSILLSISIILGTLWYGDYYGSKPSFLIFFEVSPGISLLLFALLPGALLKIITIRIFLILLIIIGAASCIYKIPIHWNLINGPDYGAIILQLIILCLMGIILKNIIRRRE